MFPPFWKGCSKTAVDESYVLDPVLDCYPDTTHADASCGSQTGADETITCLDGTWSENLNTSCGNCSTSDFGDDVTRNPSGDVIDFDVVVNFTCSGKNKQSRPTNATCKAPGVWDPVDLPKCIVICGTFEIENGKGPTAVFYPSNTTTVECDEGFTIGDGGNITTEVITCKDDGEWNNEPKCSAGNILFGALYLVTVSLAMGLVTSNM
ncbi:putative complement receptor type 1-like [Apostichopus japonicus]|uniref:Putative complement receptor type 1-like n=1 Tax=Stichopus japonicus TaxID=307972 RepID=A0A2G8LMV6_STIJA|nr:putative complement receptor type 1-like [Apostichopus japonicus]